MRSRLSICLAVALLALSTGCSALQNTPTRLQADSGPLLYKVNPIRGPSIGVQDTATPIKHLVVIFQENVSFDHYFGTYPNAVNTSGEPAFHAAPGTPMINGLTQALLTNNPNANNTANGNAAINPFRLSRAQAATSSQDHDYTDEQRAFNNGAMDLFPKYTGAGQTLPGGTPEQNGKGQVMGYYDGNTVTAMWHYAQHFAMSDNSYGTNFGPSSVGAINLISGQTNGVTESLSAGGTIVADGLGGYTLIGDALPLGDVCTSSNAPQAHLGGRNIGDLLNEKNITWGFFQGGFDLTVVNVNGTTGCQRSTYSSVTQSTKADYVPHHQPFQYYTSTANLAHARPTSVATIGRSGDDANHQYDVNDFFAAVDAGNMPAVSYLKAAAYQDGHAGYSDPLDEQQFVVRVINFLQQRPEWASTAVVIAYDDSDGWYDHQASPRVNASYTGADALTGANGCDARDSLPGIAPNSQHAQGRCGFGPRLPLLVISPWARKNYVDHTLTDQSSIMRFIEDNWLNGKRLGGGSFDALAGTIESMFDFSQANTAGRRLILDEQTGEVVEASP
ncbi:phospholipase C [Dyella nitratireducens]|uniref:Phospholipase C n=1 Tax=Dyella nitratireducens TaxID=1849580 RepID=A0ABQ1G528_9GAMM|nr:alkaline phosphatase family protein [Dyella nitratireducens]GGA35719.1 phospholipase C [Dyella nitratireducens]GLQ41037.1 phospholipase C [Dyella nitratireducens]